MNSVNAVQFSCTALTYVVFMLIPRKAKTNKNNSGFTMVELLVVITIIGILSTLVLSTLNVTKQRGRAADAVRIKTLGDLANGFRGLQAAEDRLPNQHAGNPLAGPDADLVRTYISTWPGNEYFYRNIDSSTNGNAGETFYLCVESAETPGTFLKYYSSNYSIGWHFLPGTLAQCRDKVLVGCAASGGNCNVNTSNGCRTLEGIQCGAP